MANNNYLNKIRIGNEDVDIHDIRNLAASGTDGGAALKTGAIPFGIVDSTSTATAFTATVDGITELTNGTCVLLKNGVVTSAAGFTIDINNLGAHPVFNNLSAATAETTIFNVNYTMLFVYDSTRVVGESTGAWCCYRGYDSNTNTIGYQLRSNSYTKDMTDRTYRYRILFSSADNSKWVPANTSTSTSATSSKTVCQTPINPFGEIVYYGTTASVAAGSRPAATSLWQQYTLALGYSFNKTGVALTLTSWEPVYVKCAPQANGSAIIDSTTPYVQSLPSTDDGKIYIFLGVAYSATNIELLMNHPVFYYKDGAIRLWSNTADTTLGTLNTNNTTALTASSSESFGGTINLHKVSKTGSYNDLLNKPTIPDDSNLVHKSGNETISGTKTFGGENVDLGLNIGGASANIVLTVGGPVNTLSNGEFGWISVAGKGNSGETLQQALDKRNNVQSDWNQTTTTAADYIKNKPTIPDAQIQSDWDQTDTTAKDYIKNKPDLTNNNGSLDIKPYDWYGGDINIETGFDGGNITIFGGDALYLKSGDDDIYIGGGEYGEYTSIKLLSNTYYKNKEIAVKDDIKVTSVNGMTGAVNLSIPDDNNLVHKTGDETITGDKTFNGDIIIDNTNSYDIIGKFIAGPDFSWIKSQYGKFLDTTYTLQQALDERNNVQADWNLTTTTADDYIKNKPINVSSFNNDAGYLTEHQDISGKLDVITDLDTIRAGAALGSTAYQKPSTGIPKSDLAQSVQTSLGKADTALQQHQDLSSYADGAEYDSTNHFIYLKHGNTRLANPINANDFIKDGMVDTVAVTGGNLVITFNTDSGKLPITIPISDIFDANNYYTKTEIDNAGYITEHQSLDNYYTKSEVDTKTAKTTARSDNKLLYNGQSVEAVISNTGFSNTNNLLNNGFNMAIRSNSTNPFIGLKEGNNLWYAQAASNYFYFGPTSTKALRLDLAGNGVFQTGSVTATKIIKSGGTSSLFLKADGSVDNNTYLTSFTETDPTVPAWAKASTKPTYTAAEVGALPDTTIIPDAPGTLNTNNSTAQTVSSSESLSGTINLHKISKSGNYNDLLNKPSIPVDSDLVHTTGDEQISGNKTFRANGNIRLLSGWKQIYNEDDSENLLRALNLRNNVQSDWNATTGDAVILNKPTIPTVNNSTITILKNGSTVNSFTLNQSSNKTINITVPTTASDVSALPASTKYGASLSVSIDSTTYVVTALLKDLDGNNLGTAQTIDLPLESVVVSGSYDSATKKVVLTLKDGSTIDFSIADLVSGLLTEITSTNKLSADLISDGSANKVFTSTEKTKLSGIASGAEVNVQSDWNETNSSSDAYILNKPDLSIYALSSNLSTVATSGSYNDLSDKPTIPTVNNGTLSISGPSGSSTVTTDVFHANLNGDSLIAFSPGTNTTINVNSSTRTITIGTTAEPNVQSNWNETDTSSDAYILNKPTIPDITGKADKVTGAVNGNFAALDSNGNLTDSGYNYDDLNELSDLYTPATESSELAPGDTYEEAFGKLEKTITDNEYVTAQALNDLNTNKQDTLESGTNIKTINGESILGGGDFNVTGDCIAYPSFEIDSNGHLIMSGGQQGLFTLENGHLMYNF